MEELTKMGVTGWQAVVAFLGLIGGIAVFFQGWPSFITINRNCQCEECEDEDED